MSAYNILFYPLMVIMAITVYHFMHLLFNKEAENKKIEILTYFLYTVVATLAHLIFRTPILNLIVSLTMMFIITLNYRASFKQKVINVLIIYITMALIESAFAYTSDIIYIDMTNVALENNTITMIIGRLISLFVIYILRKKMKKRDKIDFPIAFFLILIIIPASSIIILINLNSNANINYYDLILSIILLLIINIIYIFIYDSLNVFFVKKNEQLIYKNQAEYYEKQLELTNSHLNDVSALKHDMANHLMTLKTLITDNHNNKAIEYLNEITPILMNDKAYSKTGNISLDSIMNFKLYEADKLNIAVNYKYEKIPELKISTFDLSIILCNLIDNAFYSVKNINNKSIEINICYEKDNIIFNIKNKFDLKPKIVDNKFVSIKRLKLGENMVFGTGIENVKSAVYKNNGKIEIEIKDEEFIVTVILI